jgi:hypothetical protein
MTGGEVGRGPVWDAVGQGLRPFGWRFLRARRTRRDLQAARRAADQRLLHAATAPLGLVWRVDEIVSDRSRLEVADALRRMVRSADPRRLPGASPLNRPAVRAQAHRLIALADRLTDFGRPVECRGVLLLVRLLGDDQGPLYVSYRAWELERALERAWNELEPA